MNIALLRSHLDCVSAIWSPYLKKDKLPAPWLPEPGIAVTKITWNLSSFVRLAIRLCLLCVDLSTSNTILKVHFTSMTQHVPLSATMLFITLF